MFIRSSCDSYLALMPAYFTSNFSSACNCRASNHTTSGAATGDNNVLIFLCKDAFPYTLQAERNERSEASRSRNSVVFFLPLAATEPSKLPMKISLKKLLGKLIYYSTLTSV